jgi:bacillithiol system protein YtxJ
VIEDMSNNFFRLLDKDSLDKLVTVSNERPVLVFKHSNACPISSRAYREMEKLDHVNLIEVQTARDVSNEIATLTGVRHETPQVIVLRDGKAVWDASHYDVSAGAVREALEANR